MSYPKTSSPQNSCDSPASSAPVSHRDTSVTLPPTSAPSKVERCAKELRLRLASKERSGTVQDFLTAPLFDSGLGDVPAVPLIAWMSFDHRHCIFDSLFSTRVPGTDERILLLHRTHTCDGKKTVVFGLTTDIMEDVEAAVIALLEANGHPSFRLFEHIPTSIFHRENWGADGSPAFGPEAARYIFRFAAVSLLAARLQQSCEILCRYPDPWQRAALSEPVAWESDPSGTILFDGVLYDKWFALVTEPAHAAREYAAYRFACRQSQIGCEDRMRANAN